MSLGWRSKALVNHSARARAIAHVKQKGLMYPYYEYQIFVQDFQGLLIARYRHWFHTIWTISPSIFARFIMWKISLTLESKQYKFACFLPSKHYLYWNDFLYYYLGILLCCIRCGLRAVYVIFLSVHMIFFSQEKVELLMR